MLPALKAQRRKWHPTPVLLPGKSHEQRSLVGYSLWGHKESDTIERLSNHWTMREVPSMITLFPDFCLSSLVHSIHPEIGLTALDTLEFQDGRILNGSMAKKFPGSSTQLLLKSHSLKPRQMVHLVPREARKRKLSILSS